MDECQHAMEELRNIVEGISKLRDTAYAHYSLLVEQVLKDQITDEQQLEQIMDGLCDFCECVPRWWGGRCVISDCNGIPIFPL